MGMIPKTYCKDCGRVEWRGICMHCVTQSEEFKKLWDEGIEKWKELFPDE